MCRRIGSRLGDLYSDVPASIPTQPLHMRDLSNCASYISAVHSGPAAWAEVTEAAHGLLRSGREGCSRRTKLVLKTAIAHMHGRRQEAGETALDSGETDTLTYRATPRRQLYCLLPDFGLAPNPGHDLGLVWRRPHCRVDAHARCLTADKGGALIGVTSRCLRSDAAARHDRAQQPPCSRGARQRLLPNHLAELRPSGPRAPGARAGAQRIGTGQPANGGRPDPCIQISRQHCQPTAVRCHALHPSALPEHTGLIAPHPRAQEHVLIDCTIACTAGDAGDLQCGPMLPGPRCLLCGHRLSEHGAPAMYKSRRHCLLFAIKFRIQSLDCSDALLVATLSSGPLSRLLVSLHKLPSRGCRCAVLCISQQAHSACPCAEALPVPAGGDRRRAPYGPQARRVRRPRARHDARPPAAAAHQRQPRHSAQAEL